MYEETFCTDCKKFTQVICDHAAGDMICTECGLVLESHCIDETSEWRTFSDSVDKDDPVRVGCPTNPLLADFALTTVISKAPKAKATTETKTGDTNNNRFTLGRCNSRGSLNNEPDRALVLGFQKIDLMADKLGLVHTITTRAKEICKKLEDQKCTRGRNQNAILAACLLIACRQEEKERTLKEIFSIANGATMKQIGQAQKFIVKQLDLGEVGTINTGGCMNRFCSLLGMSHRTSKAAQEAVMKCEEVDIRRSPTTLAAVIIYVLNQLSDDKKSLKSIAMVTGVAETTIRSSYKDLYPHVSKIIPGWYAKEADLRKLCCP